MKKNSFGNRIIMCAMLTLAIAFTSCGGKTTDSKDKEEKSVEGKQTVSNVTATEEDKFIAFLEDGLGILKNASLTTDDDITALVKKLSQLKEERNDLPENPGENLTDDERKTFEAKVEDLFNRIQTETNRLYQEAEDNGLDTDRLRGYL